MPSVKHRIAAPLVVAATALLLLAVFAAPAADQEPRELPLGLAGPAPAVEAVAAGLEAKRPGAFELSTYADAAAARAAIEDRDVYGALVLAAGRGGAEPSGTTLLLASAASPAVAQLLAQAGAELGVGRQLDLVASPAEDPRGTGLIASVLPLLLASLLGGVAVARLAAAPGSRLGGLAVVAVVVGAVGALALQTWIGALDGPWLANAAALALLSLAVASVTVGAVAWLGLAGIGVAAALVVLLGNAWSAAPSAPQLLPEPIGAIGQLLPPGAGVSLLRSTAFFDGSAAAVPLLVLLGWTALGLAALAGAGIARSAPRPGAAA